MKHFALTIPPSQYGHVIHFTGELVAIEWTGLVEFCPDDLPKAPNLRLADCSVDHKQVSTA